MSPYNFREIEKKWQSYWQEHHSFRIEEQSSKKPFYVLEMFPYPSGTLHMGHARNYTIGDVLARYRWAQGYMVLHPMGWDACGLPAENAALTQGIHPKAWTYHNAEIMKAQCQSLGFSHDWSREIFSCDPAYFRHEQKIFLDFYSQGLAYRKKSYVNWDPVEQSVLANEQVIDGRGWRSGALVEKRLLEQWFLRITHFAEELLDELKNLHEWPESVKQMQVNWIGRSQGLSITFDLVEGGSFQIFSTRPETLYGATFCALSPDHSLAQEWAQDQERLADFIEAWRHKGTSSRIMETEEKHGIFTGQYAIHPLMPEIQLPIYIANYIVGDYATGAIFGCPAHDQRDFELAKVCAIPIIPVIRPFQPEDLSLEAAYVGDGLMINSQHLNGLTVDYARQRITHELVERGIAKRELIYRLKDWGIGRQRYWGVPIPIIHCPNCGIVPVPEDQLPVVLPEDVHFDHPGNPLERHPSWKHVLCPTCGEDAQRETDTFDTFMESSWYFGRFCDPHNAHQAFDKEKAQHWMPVQQYIGGIEHAVLHLLYARFFTKALKQCGYWSFSEPFKGLFTQGMVCHKTFQRADTKQWLYPEEVIIDKGEVTYQGIPVIAGRSEKMSKSKRNVVGVTSMVETYGADAVRFFLLSDTPPSKDMEWTDEGIEGAWRYVKRLWTLFHQKIPLCKNRPLEKPTYFSEKALGLRKQVHQGIRSASQAIEQYELNKYVAYLREYSNSLAACEPSSLDEQWALWEGLTAFVLLLAPAMPHLAEELGALLGFQPGLHLLSWPMYEENLLIKEKATLAVQVNGKMRGTLEVPIDASEDDIIQILKKEVSLAKYIQGSWDKFIVIPGRVISLVIKSLGEIDRSKRT